MAGNVPFWALKRVWEARALRAWRRGAWAGEKNERKKWRNENGVMDRIRQSNAPRTMSSIRRIVWESNMNPSSLCAPGKKSRTIDSNLYKIFIWT